MGRKALIVFACAWLLSLVTPVSAQGIIGRGWLERLSGPGPFTGLVLDARLVCLAEPVASRGNQTDNPFEGTLGGRLTYPKTLESRVWVTGAGCHFLPRDQPRMQIGIDLGFLDSKRNVLDYSHLEGITEDDAEVNLSTLMVTADLRVNRILDVGAAIGRGYFSSPSDLFPDFSRMVTQPMRLTTRPLSAFMDDKRAEALIVRFDGTRFHGTFIDEDFGARPGTYIEPGEIIWTWSVRADIFAFFWGR